METFSLTLALVAGEGPYTTAGTLQRIPYEIPELWGLVHWGFVIAVVLALVMAAVLSSTRWGYEVRISGANPENALYAAIPVQRRIMVVMLISGAIAGIAGILEVAGTVHRLQSGISNNFGYLGIIVAALANRSCLAVFATGALMAFILNAGIILQTQGLTTSAVVALTGLVMLFTAVGEELACYRLVRVTGAGKQDASWKS